MIRTGDQIISKRGETLIVEDIIEDFDGFSVQARNAENGRRKIFIADDLECVDADDGLWQEMERRD